MLAVNGVTVRFGKRILFEDVNIKFGKGNCYGIIGANGAGKSTFLKVLSGELEPSKGDVSIDKGERISILKQDHFAYDDEMVLDAVIMGNQELYSIMKEKEEIYAKEDFSEEDGMKAAKLEERFAELDGWNAETNAATLLNDLGISPENIIKGIETFSLTKNRMEVVKIKDNVTVINDAYNASYDSMKPALEYLSELPANRKIAVLGDMFELGEFSEEIHRKVGIEVVTHKIDILVTVGKLAKYIAEEAKYLRMPEENIISLETTEEASKYLNKILQKDDAVLLKAAHGMHFSEIFKSIKD